MAFIIEHWPLFLALFVVAGLLALTTLWDRVVGLRSVEPEQAVRLMNRGALVLDLRPEPEFREGHLAAAVSAPPPELSQRLGKLARKKNKPVLLVAPSQQAGIRAAAELRKAEFSDIYLLKGGLRGWTEAQLPLSR